MKRRFFLFAAPAIVAAPSLMRVSTALQLILPEQPAYWRTSGVSGLDGLITATLRNRSHKLAENVIRNNALLKHLMDRNWVGSAGETTYYGRVGAELAPDGWEEDAWQETA